jgi:hypothetical protein
MKNKLISAVTQYDRKQATKRGYNNYALGIYFERVDAVCADVEAGADPRAAITAGFSGRLADACLEAVGLDKATDAENRSDVWCYTPISEKKI